MKKIVALFTALLILLSGFNISVATHICGGKLVAVKWSISGEKATCGMKKNACPFASKTHAMKPNCCQDHASYYSVDDDYSQSVVISLDFSKKIELYPVFNPTVASAIRKPSFLQTAFAVDIPLPSRIYREQLCIYLI